MLSAILSQLFPPRDLDFKFVIAKIMIQRLKTDYKFIMSAPCIITEHLHYILQPLLFAV